jgi:hypothetical protein
MGGELGDMVYVFKNPRGGYFLQKGPLLDPSPKTPIQLRVQTINIEFRLTGVPIRFVKFAPLRKLRSSEAGQPPIYYLFESESAL